MASPAPGALDDFVDPFAPLSSQSFETPLRANFPSQLQLRVTPLVSQFSTQLEPRLSHEMVAVLNSIGQIMKSEEEFLRSFHRDRVSASAHLDLSSAHSPEIEMDSTLTSALSREWYIAPVLARSRYFSRQALAGDPTLDFVQVCGWVREYTSDGCNWAVETGARSGLLILEFDYEVGRQTLRDLSKDDKSWCKTLQFTDLNSRFVCFRKSGRRTHIVGRDLPGIQIHWDNLVLIPPSVLNSGAQIAYLNPGTRVLDLPDWLLDVRRIRTKTKSTSQDDEGDYAAA